MSNANQFRQWARCNTCGSEVLFDAWVSYSGEVESVFDHNFCVECDGEVGCKGFTVVTNK